MKKKREFPQDFPRVGQTVRFLALHMVHEDVKVTVEATVQARMYWDAGNSGHNIITSAPEFHEIEYHGPPEKDSDSWGGSRGIDSDGNIVNYSIYDLEVLQT